MASSGTYGFTVSRDDLIAAALRLTGAFGDQDVIPPSDIQNCAQALNILAKELALDGLPLWCVQDISFPTVIGQAAYNLSTIAGMTLPQRILDAYIRDQTGNDVTLTIVSRYDYDTLGQKAQQSVPNQCWYDPQIGAGILTLYDVPADNTHMIHVVIQRQIQDFNLATDTPDFPQEAYRLLKWCLADEISLEYQATKDVRLEINQKATGYRDKFFASPLGEEQASVFFTPSERKDR
jgi:hypothetical protein